MVSYRIQINLVRVEPGNIKTEDISDIDLPFNKYHIAFPFYKDVVEAIRTTAKLWKRVHKHKPKGGDRIKSIMKSY